MGTARSYWDPGDIAKVANTFSFLFNWEHGTIVPIFEKKRKKFATTVKGMNDFNMLGTVLMGALFYGWISSLVRVNSGACSS